MADPIEEGLKIIPELTAEALRCLGEYAIRDFALPKPEWQYHLGDLTISGVTAPNRFHRFMQRACLGIKWERIGV